SLRPFLVPSVDTGLSQPLCPCRAIMDRRGTSDCPHARAAAAAEARVAESARARLAELSSSQGVDALAEPPHGVRGSAVPEHRRMLEPWDGDLHDPRRRLHACVLVLR